MTVTARRLLVAPEAVTAAIYMAITLLGVIAAASWKGLFADFAELVVIIIGTTVTVAVAHAWANVASHRLLHRTRMTKQEKIEELQSAGCIVIVGIFASATLAEAWWITDDLNGAVRMTIGILIAILFALGVIGARRGGAPWGRALGWGLADASIGIVVLVLKVTLGS